MRQAITKALMQFRPKNSAYSKADSIAELVTLGIDDLIVFYDYVRVSGWVHHPHATLKEVWLQRGNQRLATGQAGLPKAGIQLGENLGFCVSLLDNDWKGQGNFLQLRFSDGSQHQVDCDEISTKLMNVPNVLFPSKEDQALTDFHQHIQAPHCRSILEIGSRARSQVVRREWFPHLEYTGIDILEGENVDIVGDAHELSRLCGDKKFDAVFSMNTFEHLAMPWKVALELNKVMNLGGVGYLHAPQSTGLHDLPWDFWRFADMGWRGLFNEHTGFEILTTSYTLPMYLVPFVYTDHWRDYEKAVGYAGSTVLFRKIGETRLSWDVPTQAVTLGVYPA